MTKTVEIKKQRNKSTSGAQSEPHLTHTSFLDTNRTRVIKKVIPTDSFFNFFKPPQPPSMDDLEGGDVNEEELEALDEKLEIDYQIGEDLKERVRISFCVVITVLGLTCCLFSQDHSPSHRLLHWQGSRVRERG